MVATKLTKELVEAFIPSRDNNSKKGDNGKVLIVGGSYIYHGAPVLSSLAALRSGSDLVYTCVPKINVFSTRSISPDLIVIPMADSKLTRGTVNKMLGQIPVDIDSTSIGMGLAIQDVEAIKLLVKSLLDRNVRISLDASSLIKEILPIIEGQNVVVTPHLGEFKRLFGESIENDSNARLSTCEKFAKKHSLTILLKGQKDIITNGDISYTNSTNSPCMTVGGTGDVLSGLVAGFLSRNKNVIESASAATFVNGAVGELLQKEVGNHILASDLISKLPTILNSFDN
ncbi:NAD(P)H-hydrate dehydratase [Candidatus Nitrosopelagicus sp.]|nr:NAD(P)H-hydrate dehydratase [Candidatus Nitrosopelagicus sp.]